MPIPTHVPRDTLRAEFSWALSEMYRKEVPLYGDLVSLVNEINEGKVQEQGEGMGGWQYADRLNVERHGAIRLGTPFELHTIARLFALMGMFPVGYYDLSTSGVPVHSTAFRPVSGASLAINPFRVFTSLLRPDLISDASLRAECLGILAKRNIFHPGLIPLLEQAERSGGLEREQADRLVEYALETFRWHDRSLVCKDTYNRMRRCHPLLADVVGFRGPHINHLTPRVLDIDLAQAGMAKRGIPPKDIIEGPPHRLCPILLRQTSFKALTEPILFAEFDSDDGEGIVDDEVFAPGSASSLGSSLASSMARSSRRGSGGEMGSHRARFGEIESRGAALTLRGHELYLSLLSQVPARSNETNEGHQRALSAVFRQFPDTWSEIRIQGLAYFRYFLEPSADHGASDSPRSSLADAATPEPGLDELISSGVVGFEPIVYEDFLPASAAGIFQSNLVESSQATSRTAEAMPASTALVPGSTDGRQTPRDGSSMSDSVATLRAATVPRLSVGDDALIDETTMFGHDPDVDRDAQDACDTNREGVLKLSSKEVFEQALGGKTADYFELYEKMQRASLEEVRKALGLVQISARV